MAARESIYQSRAVGEGTSSSSQMVLEASSTLTLSQNSLGGHAALQGGDEGSGAKSVHLAPFSVALSMCSSREEGR